MTVSQSSNFELDLAVANAEGLLAFGYENDKGRLLITLSSGNTEYFQPTMHWSQGGPIIERERISVGTHEDYWSADITAGETGFIQGHGPTPLIAAMRCFVASKFGDEVETPEELTA